MKIITISLFLFATQFIFGQATQPSGKVKAAYTAAELGEMSPVDIESLNIIAEHLCWFETVKSENLSEIYSLRKKDGQLASLSEKDLDNFNPLIYQLPQDEMKYGNLVIRTIEGKNHLLIVRSKSKMDQKIKEVKIMNAKKGNK